LIGSAFFAKLTAGSTYTLQCTAPSPLKIAPLHGRSGVPSNTRFLGPTIVYNSNGISIGSAVFAGLTIVTDRQIEWQTTVLRLWQQAASTCVVPRCGLKLTRTHQEMR